LQPGSFPAEAAKLLPVSVAVIGGTGDEGFGLSLRLARAGEDVVIGSRAEDRGQAAAQKAADVLGLGSGSGTRGGIEGTSNEKAAAACDIVFVTVPYAGQAEIYRSIKDALRPGAIVCDTTTPLATAVGRPAWHVVTPWEGSAAEQAKAIMPKGMRLVSGFQTVSGHALQELEHDLEGDVLLCGAEAEAKAVIGALVEKIPNLRWIDAGPLSMARIVEPLTAVLVSVNRSYGITNAGISLTGRQKWGPPRAQG
jgi:NADPH-dependent F420 reductase